MKNTAIFVIILISAACTLFMRVLPFTILGRKREIPQKIQYLGKILPPAIMAVLIVYCLKDVPSDFKGVGMEKLLASAICIAVHLWKNHTFFSIIVGTAAYMILCSVW